MNDSLSDQQPKGTALLRLGSDEDCEADHARARALEVIALGESSDPVKDANDALVESGWWTAAVNPSPAPAPETGADSPKCVSGTSPAVGAEPLGYLSEHTGPEGPFKWQFSKTLAGVYRDTALRIIPVYEPPEHNKQP